MAEFVDVRACATVRDSLWSSYRPRIRGRDSLYLHGHRSILLGNSLEVPKYIKPRSSLSRTSRPAKTQDSAVLGACPTTRNKGRN
jgi:hypothetical protein